MNLTKLYIAIMQALYHTYGREIENEVSRTH